MFIGLGIYTAVCLFAFFGLPALGASPAISYTTSLLMFLYVVYLDHQKRNGPRSVRHIPIMPNIPVLGHLPYISIKFGHLSLSSWSKKLGSVMRVITAGEMIVVATGYAAIRDVSIIIHV